MSKLFEKLRPKTKERLGKVVPCTRCGRDAECYSANYIHCPRCDSPKPKAAVKPLPKPEFSSDEYGFIILSTEDDSDDEVTLPGWGDDV